MLTSSYASLMVPALTELSVSISLLSALYIYVVIPANLITLIVIVKTKKLWTASNVVLAVNGLIQLIGSSVMLFSRLSFFPGLFFDDEEQRRLWFVVEWWTVSITFRTSCTRYVLKTINSMHEVETM